LNCVLMDILDPTSIEFSGHGSVSLSVLKVGSESSTYRALAKRIIYPKEHNCAKKRDSFETSVILSRRGYFKIHDMI